MKGDKRALQAFEPAKGKEATSSRCTPKVIAPVTAFQSPLCILMRGYTTEGQTWVVFEARWLSEIPSADTGAHKWDLSWAGLGRDSRSKAAHTSDHRCLIAGLLDDNPLFPLRPCVAPKCVPTKAFRGLGENNKYGGFIRHPSHQTVFASSWIR